MEKGLRNGKNKNRKTKCIAMFRGGARAKNMTILIGQLLPSCKKRKKKWLYMKDTSGIRSRNSILFVRKPCQQ